MGKKKKKKQTKGGGSLRKAMKKAGAFKRKGPGKPEGPPGEVKPSEDKG